MKVSNGKQLLLISRLSVRDNQQGVESSPDSTRGQRLCRASREKTAGRFGNSEALYCLIVLRLE